MNKEKAASDSTEQTGRESLAKGAAPRDIAAAPGTKARKKANLVYLGPTIIGAMRHGTTFKDGELPENAQECLKEFPAMERLLVEVDEMPGAVTELRKRQSVLETVYKQTEEHFSAQRLIRRS